MNFLSPLAFALAALAIPIVALYFLKLRREERVVPSTFLWRHLVRDTAANAPWQRLRPNLLLFLQLLVLLLLILALARPFVWSQNLAGDHLIVILDTSASMQATDTGDSRLSAAVREAHRLIASLPSESRVTVIAAGSETNVLVSGATDRSQVDQALRRVEAGAGSSDLSAALSLASAIASREQDPETVVLSDGNVLLPEHLSLPGRARYVPVGRSDEAADNQAITALSLRPTAGGQSLLAFAQVANFAAAPVERRLALFIDGELFVARTLTLAANEIVPLTFEDLPAGASTVEARLEGGDALAVDDIAWAVSPAHSSLRIDLVGPGNRFLETALALLPGLEVTTVQPDDYTPPACTEGDADCRLPDLTVFDGTVVPETLPAGALLFLAPVQATGFFSVTGEIEGPRALPARADEPLLRYVDLRGLQIQSAAQIPLPDWARAVVVTEDSQEACAGHCPLLFAGEVGGRRVGVMAFDLRRSDLPLRVAFPLLLTNLLDYLNAEAGAGSLPNHVAAGQPLPLVLPADATGLIVSAPDGATHRLDATASPVFGDTGRLGIYEISVIADGGDERPMGRFAVNLFDPRESAIATQNTLAIQGSADAGATGEGRESRQEWWRPLAWLGLAVLLGEWLYAHRGQVQRVRGAVSSRLAGATAGRTGASKR